jgi:hypothetical protein
MVWIDYLLSGLMYIPSGRLDAFYTTRISPSLQGSISCITEPQTNIQPGYDMNSSSGSALFRLQHDTGRWGTEYSWNSDGGIFGLCVLRNFGRLGAAVDGEDSERKQLSSSRAGVKRVDEEEAMEGGLKGRVSLGAEIYASAERSAGGTFPKPSYIPKYLYPSCKRSFNGDAVYYTPRNISHKPARACTGPVFKQSASSTATNDDYCGFQPDYWTHSNRICCADVTRCCVVLAVLFQYP